MHVDLVMTVTRLLSLSYILSVGDNEDVQYSFQFQGVEICETKGREIIAYSKKLVFDVKQIDQRVKECIEMLSKLDIYL